MMETLLRHWILDILNYFLSKRIKIRMWVSWRNGKEPNLVGFYRFDAT